MNVIAFITPGPTDWLLILVIVLVLFGAGKLPELARGLGQSLNEFRKAREDFDRSWRDAEVAPAAPARDGMDRAEGPAETAGPIPLRQSSGHHGEGAST